MRIANRSRVLAAIGLCGLGYVVALPFDVGNLSFVSLAAGQGTALTKPQSEALDAYNKTVQDFKAILAERRAQINAKQTLPDLPGQALYLARNAMMSAYKDLTDVMPSRIGRPNKYKIPPAYFDADNEPLIDEYKALRRHAGAARQCAEIRYAVQRRCRSRHGDCAGQRPRSGACRSRRPHQPRAVLCRDQWQPKYRQCALEHLQGKFSDRRVRGSRSARKKWAAIKKSDRRASIPR